MAQYYYIAYDNPAPYAAGATTTPSGGSGAWPAGTYSFLVVAWYRADETDGAYAGAWGPVIANSAADAAGGIDLFTGKPRGALYTPWWTITTASNDNVVLEVAKANSGDVDHYSVYYVEDVIMPTDAKLTRLTHTEVDNGDGTITMTIPNANARTASTALTLLAKSASASTYTVVGDVRVLMGAGSTITISGATTNNATHTVLSATLNTDGLSTILAVDSTLLDDIADGNCTTLLGTYEEAKYMSGYYGGAGGVLLSLIEDSDFTARAGSVRTSDGRMVRKSYSTHTAHDTLSVRMHIAGVSASTYALLQKWADAQVDLFIGDYDVVGSTYNRNYVNGYRGRLQPIPEHGKGGKNAKSYITLTFDIIEELRYDGSS